jgi:ABC-type branched-subunit amino acid transport system ATPase component
VTAVGLLTVEGVSVAFGGIQALQDVSLSVPEGAVVGLIGPNGAGKTTLFDVISGLRRPSSGRILLAGSDLSTATPPERAAAGMARAFQNLGLMLDETVEVNVLASLHLKSPYRGWATVLRPVTWARGERDLHRRVSDILDSLGLSRHRHDAVGALSFGTARFVELACVLAREPRLLLLDEPTTGLDLAEVERLRGILHRVRGDGTTVLLVAHDVRFVMTLCDHVYVLSGGRLLAEGPPLEVQVHPEVIEAYLGRTA